MSLTTIRVSTDVRERLKRLASKGETYDAVLRRVIQIAEARILYERERRILETEDFGPRVEV
jgi:Arc/MetJ family transcription regulator